MLRARSLVLAIWFLLPIVGARADFMLVTDPAAIGKNDTAAWNANLSPSFRSAIHGVIVSWSEQDQSLPSSASLVAFNGGGLFIGTAVEPSYGPGTAFFALNLRFDVPLTAVGAFIDIGNLPSGNNGTDLVTAYDAMGNSRVFNLAPLFNAPGGYSGYLGVRSTVPLTGLEFFSSQTGATAESAITIVTPLDLHVIPTPAPPGPVLMLMGVAGLSLGAVVSRWRAKPS